MSGNKGSYDIKCERCGELMIGVRKNRRFCQPCGHRHMIEENARRHRERRQQDKATTAHIKKPQPRPRLTITEIDALAEAEGTSYGKYVAKHGL